VVLPQVSKESRDSDPVRRPDGIVEANIEVDRVIGCVVYPAAELAEPGIVRHIR